MIRDYQALQHTWFAKGKQRIIKTTGKHRGVKLLATLDYGTKLITTVHRCFRYKLLFARGRKKRVITVLQQELRAFEEAGATFIVAEGCGKEGIGAAIMNRLTKAAGGRIVRV
jgi:hypothetical protein